MGTSRSACPSRGTWMMTGAEKFAGLLSPPDSSDELISGVQRISRDRRSFPSPSVPAPDICTSAISLPPSADVLQARQPFFFLSRLCRTNPLPPLSPGLARNQPALEPQFRYLLPASLHTSPRLDPYHLRVDAVSNTTYPPALGR